MRFFITHTFYRVKKKYYLYDSIYISIFYTGRNLNIALKRKQIVVNVRYSKSPCDLLMLMYTQIII